MTSNQDICRENDERIAAAMKRQAARVKFYNRARRRGLTPEQAMNVTRAHFGEEEE